MEAPEGKTMKPQGFMHIILFKEKWPQLIFKILVAMVYSFGEVKPGCRKNNKITTYVPSPGNLAVLEMLSRGLPTSAPYELHLCRPIKSPLGKNKAKSKTRGNNALKYFKDSPTFLRLSLVRLGTYDLFWSMDCNWK